MSEEKVDGGKVIAEKEPEKKKEVISKADTMFKVDNNGNLIPEKIPIEIYDRGLDGEIMEEAELLAQMIKRESSFKEMSEKLIKDTNNEIKKLDEELGKEADDKNKKDIQQQIDKRKATLDADHKRNKLMLLEVEKQISESREILKRLKGEKQKQIEEKYIEAIPLTTAEALFVFEKNKSPTGKETDDPVAEIVALCLKNPVYTVEEAKKLKINYKLAIRDAIMELSNYTSKSYREVMLENLRSPLKKQES